MGGAIHEPSEMFALSHIAAQYAAGLRAHDVHAEARRKRGAFPQSMTPLPDMWSPPRTLLHEKAHSLR